MELNRLSLPPLTAPGEVITFYSYKGGTGRTMALSNIAVMLARRQNATVPILMIDWDLEAPGLHRYFGKQLFSAFRGSEQELRGYPAAARRCSLRGTCNKDARCRKGYNQTSQYSASSVHFCTFLHRSPPSLICFGICRTPCRCVHSLKR